MKNLFFVVFVSVNCVNVRTLDVFHEPSKIVYVANVKADYFGYSVLFSDNGLVVGAPKATSRSNKYIAPGLVFNCKLDDLDKSSIECTNFGIEDYESGRSKYSRFPVRSFFRNDMWFGATVAEIPKGNFLICAPRWTDPYRDQHLLANGACYITAKNRKTTLTPLVDNARLAYVTDGSRKEFGEYGTHLNFYAYAQAGMSLTVTGNDSFLIGAPGLLQWTGGIVEYKFVTNEMNLMIQRQSVSNPYFTKDLGPDDYFGYSVESGIFEPSGKVLHISGAPRSKDGYGQVLIFEPATREDEKLKIRVKLTGTQLGSYFGATLSCVDVNADGKLDLLVGAPNYVTTDGRITFDEGAVFVLLNKEFESGFTLEDSGFISGSGISGARFGSAISVLGDINDDGYTDIAVGAPWEVHSDKDAGVGAVYIFKGGPNGVASKYVQRIAAKSALGFGISITKGMDVDRNKCNDLAVGAFKSAEVYLYRCVPTIRVRADIKVPNAMDLPQNASSFLVLFCISSPPKKYWSHVKIDLDATIIVDPESDKARITGDSNYTVTISPGKNMCEEQEVEVKKTADLSKPIQLIFKIEEKHNKANDSQKFPRDAARLSEDSQLQSSFDIQLTRDCGKDLICSPLLKLTMSPLADPYIPGTDTKLGLKITVFNQEEPAYGAKVHLNLPLQPKRVSGDCSLVDYNMTCNVPSPLPRSGSVSWEIELEYNLKTNGRKELKVQAVLIEPFYNERKIFESTIVIAPKATFGLNGKALPNVTIPISRESFYHNNNITFVHNFQITNYGPSDWYYLAADLDIPNKLNLTNPVEICDEEILPQCIITSVPANTTIPVILPFIFDLVKYGHLLEEEENLRINFTTSIILGVHNMNTSVTTVLILDPVPPIWPLVVGTVMGLLLLSAIIYGLYRYGFFTRHRLERLQEMKDEDSASGSLIPDDQGPSGAAEALSTDYESSRELIIDESQ